MSDSADHYREMSAEARNHEARLRSGETVGEAFTVLGTAARDRTRISGWTHNFYRYPARFSPKFAAAAIESFSRAGETVLDPYMGGGTVLVEGLVAGRNVIGNDLNSLATFITKVKTTPLDSEEISAMKRWANNEVPKLTYRAPSERIAAFLDLQKTRNLSLARARFIKKAVAAALATIGNLPTRNAQDFARCVVLRVGQWALDGREKHTPLRNFRTKLRITTHEMLEALISLARHVAKTGSAATILNGDASTLGQLAILRDPKNRPSLVVTSPPYPGVHVLYHRWQVDGRRETPAPYWIAGCDDGQGASYYNFGDRRETAADDYFRNSLTTLKAIRQVIQDGGYVIQMVAFNRPRDQMPRYLENMRAAGFGEIPPTRIKSANQKARIWREVPNRKWHATLNGRTHSAQEVVLIHKAI
jgi:DNA modification methylase